MDAINQKNDKKLSKVLSTKLSIEDYNAFLTLTKLEYQVGLIKEESTSELLRFTILHILSQAHNQPEYLILKEQEQNQRPLENNQQQQQPHNQVILPSLSTTAASDQQRQVPNTSRRSNFVSQKMTSWKLSTLLST
jgi:hypothetical protein